MIIAVDIDNTINNLQEAVIKLFNEQHGTNYTLTDFNDYDIENVLPVKEAVAMKEMYGDNDIYDYVKPLTGAKEGLQKLISDGDQVYLVTAAIPKNYYQKVEWIHHFFPFVDDAHIVSMKHKGLFNCDIMIEDNIKNLIASTLYHRICVDYPWNRNVHDYVYDIHRCANWNEIVKAVKKIKEKE